ncbi:hypothetical protein N7448_011191 [Penicillium atrosanguineum]|nr:hypothetical protein N7448_011191 [Penicillium atrosanguineum]
MRREPLELYLGHYTYLISSAGWGFPIPDAAALMRALRIRLTEPSERSDSAQTVLRQCSESAH